MKLPMLFVLAALCTVGCTGGNDARLETHRQQFLLDEEPSEIVTILDIQETDGGLADAAVVGRIGGIKNPWTKGKAEFVITDPGVFIEESAHDADCDCPFCQRDKSDPLHGRAMVQFTDERGDVVPIDARKLFDVEEQQMVVVQGRADRDGQGNVVIAARGLYIRR